MNTFSNIFNNLRVWAHIAFWGFFILSFIWQNPEADLIEYISWFAVLGVWSVVVYTNLYFLVPKYFFKKKYFAYLLFLLVTIISGSLLLKLIFISGNSTFAIPFSLHFTNLLLQVVFTSSLKFIRILYGKQKQLEILENQQLKTELSLLKAQVNPHFLFNTLNNLYGLIVQNQNEHAGDITLKLSDLMRYLLESSKTDKVSLNKELQFIEDYLSLEKIRLSKKTDIRFEISGIDKEVFIAPLIFIPLVENAFKHGLQAISDKSFAHFSLSVQGNDLFFQARNSVGKSLDNQITSGTGLDNLRKRLQIIYPEKHQMDIEQLKTSFKVILHVQL